MSDLVDATPGACAQFVQSLGLPELKAKRLLAALGGAAHGEVPPAIVACTHVCPRASCHGAVVGGTLLPPARRSRSVRTATSCVSFRSSLRPTPPTPMATRYNSQRLQTLHRASNLDDAPAAEGCTARAARPHA